ncbi:MAG TPA: hypothetical protein VM143_03545 [Acidimicrobiales bacterium]|nr:hypothetical protein [Acidimicrobiales bacterium]
MSTGGSSGPDQNQLDDLQERIEDVREDVNDGTELDDEPRFVDAGTEDEAVDDTIAPG